MSHMKKKLISIYAAAAAMTGATGAMAQEQLHKEITVEREIVPELRASSRLNLYPRPLTFKPSKVTLEPSDYLETGEITPMIATLEPAQTAAAAPLTPYRGYVDAGYFPLSEVCLSAGYAVVQTDKTRMNVWGQFDNNSYSGRPMDDAGKADLWNMAAVAGVDFSHRFGEAGTLSASTAFTYDAFTRPNAFLAKAFGEETDFARNQNVVQWDLKALWSGHAGNDVDYHAGGGFGLMDFGKGVSFAGMNSLTADAADERDFNVDLGLEKRFGSSRAGVDFDGRFAHYTVFRGAMPDMADADVAEEWARRSGKTIGVLSFRPYYRYVAGKAALKAGVKLDFSVNSGKVFHVAPDVMLAVNPASGFGGWIALGGGEELNSLRELFGITRFVSPLRAYKTSNIPLTGDLGLRFGPVKGASLTVKLSYAMANDRLMPVMGEFSEIAFVGENLRSWKINAEFNWAYRKLVSVRAAYSTVLGGGDKQTWTDWYDRARHVVSAALAITPTDRVGIDVSYDLRMRRRMLQTGMPEGFEWVNLKNESVLNAGVSYRVSDAFTVFLRGENLLNCRSMLVPSVPRQGITGFAGVGLKF